MPNSQNLSYENISNASALTLTLQINKARSLNFTLILIIIGLLF